MKLIRIDNHYLPLRGFRCLTVLVLLFVRDDLRTPVDEQELRHEGIHAAQQREVLALGLLLALLAIPLCGLAWAWLAAVPCVPFLLYGLAWVAELLLPPRGLAYRNICFETEAIYNEADPEYLRHRKPFAWMRYISNRKYPYIPRARRGKPEPYHD